MQKQLKKQQTRYHIHQQKKRRKTERNSMNTTNKTSAKTLEKKLNSADGY